MSKIYTSADQLIGRTPLLELKHIEKELGLEAKLVAKLEYFDPAGSVKDRIAKVDWFVAGVGTGVTASGVGRFLEEKDPAVKVAAVEPKDSPVLSEGHAGSHKIQGIGAGFVPDTGDRYLSTPLFAE